MLPLWLMKINFLQNEWSMQVSSLLSKMKNINEFRFSRVIYSEVQITIFYVIFLLELCCSFKCPSAQPAVVLGMQEGIKLLRFCHCNGGKWLMKGDRSWLHLFLLVNPNVCSLSENSACFWEGSQQWVSLAKWAILLIWSDLKVYLQLGWGAEEGVRRLIYVPCETQIIGSGIKFFAPMYFSMKVFERLFLWNTFVSSKK